MIRTIKLEELALVEKLAEQYRQESEELRSLRYNDNLFKYFIEHGCALFYEKDGKVLGGLIGSTQRDFMFDRVVAYESAVFLVPEARSQGAGKELVQAFESCARDKGAECVYAGSYSNTNTIGAFQMYKHNDFKLKGFVAYKEL